MFIIFCVIMALISRILNSLHSVHFFSCFFVVFRFFLKINFFKKSLRSIFIKRLIVWIQIRLDVWLGLNAGFKCFSHFFTGFQRFLLGGLEIDCFWNETVLSKKLSIKTNTGVQRAILHADVNIMKINRGKQALNNRLTSIVWIKEAYDVPKKLV